MKWSELKDGIIWYLDNYIIFPIKDAGRCIANLWKWKKIICQDRWWDYNFMLRILLFKLKDMNEYWGTSTHYIGDLDDKKLLEEMIEDLEWMVNEDKEVEMSIEDFEEEYQKRSKRFWGRMERHHRKFWD